MKSREDNNKRAVECVYQQTIYCGLLSVIIFFKAAKINSVHVPLIGVRKKKTLIKTTS